MMVMMMVFGADAGERADANARADADAYTDADDDDTDPSTLATAYFFDFPSVPRTFN